MGVILFLHLSFIVCLLLYILLGFQSDRQQCVVCLSSALLRYLFSTKHRPKTYACDYIHYITCIHHTFAGYSGNGGKVTVYSVCLDDIGFAGM